MKQKVKYILYGSKHFIMRELKKIRIGFIILGILGVVFFIFRQIQLSKEYSKNYLNDSYYGVIKDIKYIEGKRGCPDIKIGNEKYYMGFDAEGVASYYIEVGDSIVKKKNDLNVYVYRQDSSGIWKMKIFKPRL